MVVDQEDTLLKAANLLREAATEYEKVGGGATPFGSRLLEGAESLDALRQRDVCQDCGAEINGGHKCENSDL